ncbi:MAG: glutamate 5-kinase [Oscillospiraceae bacterium]|nr:glutamate 5-kinase [Oscillospiraceae bacterium]
MKQLKDARRLVIKVGTSTLTYETGRLNLRRVETLVRVLSDIKNSGREILLVTSAAIGVGAGLLGLPERPRDTAGKQAAAAVGQSELMNTYSRHFNEYGHVAGQVLITRDVIENATRKQNAVNTLTQLLAYGVVPVVNENDTVSTEELDYAFGENDTLAAIVAGLVGADALILLTDIDGLYTVDPRTDPAAEKIPVVTKIDDQLMAMTSGAGTRRGTGGMQTKLRAAKTAAAAGIPTVVMEGLDPKRLYDLLDGQPCGTLFEAE